MVKAHERLRNPDTGQFFTGPLIKIFKVVNKVAINDTDILDILLLLDLSYLYNEFIT